MYVGVIAVLFCIALSTSTAFECTIESIRGINQTLKLCRSPIDDLIIEDNQLNLLDTVIAQTPDVESVRMDNAIITSIRFVPFCTWTILKKIDLSMNEIKMLPNLLFNDCRMLSQIIFQQNEIEDIEQHAFAGLSALELLDLSKNQITVLPEYVFKPLENLKELRLGSNTIQMLDADLFNHNHYMERLFLFNNSIDAVHPLAFRPLRKLKILNIAHNPNMSSIDLHNTDSLGDVFVNDAAIRTLRIPEHVDRVNASDNSISKVTAEPGTTIRALWLSNNHLNALMDLPIMLKLNELYIENNYLSDINGYGFAAGIMAFYNRTPSLQHLTISIDNQTMNNTQFDQAVKDIKIHNISISVRDVSITVRELDIWFHVGAASVTSTTISNTERSSQNQVTERPEDQASTGKGTENVDLSDINKTFSAIQALVIVIVVFIILLTIVNTISFGLKYCGGCMFYIRGLRRVGIPNQRLNNAEEEAQL